MTSLDPAHFPSRNEHRGNATLSPRASSGRPKGPPIPDLRFEQSYLSSIQSFISYASPKPTSPSSPKKAQSAKSVRRKEAQETSEKLGIVDSGDAGNNEVVDSLYGTPIDIKWKGVAWVTTRDQLISPLIQGTVWGVLGIFLMPMSTQAGQSIRSFFGLGLRKRPLARDGTTDIGWWRKWVKSLYSGVETNAALSR